MGIFFGNLFVFGGFLEDFENNTDVYYNNLWKFDLLDRHWTLEDAGTGPSPRAFHGSTISSLHAALYVYGGATYNEQGYVFSNITIYDDFWAWNLATSSWSRIIANNFGPGPRAQVVLAYAQGKIYLFGGVVNSFFSESNDLWAYDIETNLWTNLIASGDINSPSPRSTYQLQQNPLDARIYLYGGEGPATEGFPTYNDTWMYSIANNNWTNITPNSQNNPLKNNLQAGVLVGRKFILPGGESPGGISGCGAPFPQNPTNTTWVFDIQNHSWSLEFQSETNLIPLKRHAGAADIFGPCVYIFGGWNFPSCPPGQVWNNDIYSLHVSFFP